MLKNANGEWKSVVKRIYGRKLFINYPKAVKIFTKLGYDKQYKNATVLDCYPGASVFSAALYNTIKPENHVFMEPFKSFNKYLTLEQQKNPELKVKVSDLDPFRWESFTALENEKTYTIQPQPLSAVHNQCLFIGNFTHPQGEQLCAQYLNCISNRSWIFRYGRIRMLVWVKSSTAEKLVAGPGEKFRHRIGAQRESVCDVRTVLHQPPIQAARTHKRDLKYPAALESPLMDLESTDLEQRGTHPLTLLELTPKETVPEHLEEFEYVNRMLFHTRSTPLGQSLNNLGHGAIEQLSPKLTDILHKTSIELSHEDLIRVTQAFWEWPFKPTFLHEFYEESLLGTGSGDDRLF